MSFLDHRVLATVMPRKLILLMNHEKPIGVILQACLSRLAGWRVWTVPSSTGLKGLTCSMPDAVLLDAPRLTGECIAQIHDLRTHPLTQDTPILLLTSDARWLSRQQFDELGVIGAITTPFNPLTLSQQIAELLGWSLSDPE